MCICGGRDWHELYHPLSRVSWVCGAAFIFYIFFVVFGVLNVVTGAFVDSMRIVSQQDQDVVIEEELKRATGFQNDITKIFDAADADGSGTLSWTEFEAHLQDERVKAYFNTLELDVSQARALFFLLDIDESDEVPIDKFVEGCMRMRGDAKSIDVNMLLYENEKMLCKFTNFTEYAEDQFETLKKALGVQRSMHHKSSKEWLAERRKSFGILPQNDCLNAVQQQALHTENLDAPVREAPENRRKSLSTMSGATSRLDAAIAVLAICEPPAV